MNTIRLDTFVKAIQGAILGANEALMKQNEKLLEQYFVDNEGKALDLDNATKNEVTEIHPRSVKFDYPVETDSDKPSDQFIKIDVPLITLVPLSMSQIDKTTLTSHFKVNAIDSNGDGNEDALEVEFVDSKDMGTGTLEVTLCPHEVAQGMRLLIEGYDAILKRQIPH